jgi:Holliday junction resolvase RusA-like endonuclease
VIEFVIAGDPVPWARAGSNGKQRFTRDRMAQQQQLVAGAARLAGATPVRGPVRLLVVAYRRTRRRLDWDNLGKLVSDALQGVAYFDDDQVDDARVVKALDAKRPRTEITIEPLADTVPSLRPVVNSSRLVPAVRRFRA